MEVKRLAPYTKRLFKQASLEEMEALALNTMGKLISEYGHSPKKFVLKASFLGEIPGYFIPEDDEIVLNLLCLRTARDVVYAVAHEYGHLLQCRSWGLERMMEIAYSPAQIDMFNDENDGRGYILSEEELDADRFAFAFEDGLKYKNRVMNPLYRISLFVNRKTERLRFNAPD